MFLEKKKTKQKLIEIVIYGDEYGAEGIGMSVTSLKIPHYIVLCFYYEKLYIFKK